MSKNDRYAGLPYLADGVPAGELADRLNRALTRRDGRTFQPRDVNELLTRHGGATRGFTLVERPTKAIAIPAGQVDAFVHHVEQVLRRRGDLTDPSPAP